MLRSKAFYLQRNKRIIEIKRRLSRAALKKKRVQFVLHAQKFPAERKIRAGKSRFSDFPVDLAALWTMPEIFPRKIKEKRKSEQRERKPFFPSIFTPSEKQFKCRENGIKIDALGYICFSRLVPFSERNVETS